MPPRPAIMKGTEVFTTEREDNFAFYNKYFDKDNSTISFGGFCPVNPSDMGRLYRYDSETHQMVRDFYNPEINRNFAKDPESFYRMIDSHDLSQINTKSNEKPVYFYFKPGESNPMVIGDIKAIPLTDAMLDKDDPAREAINALSKERENMSKEEKLRENNERNAYNSHVRHKRTGYTVAMLFGSNISQRSGQEGKRDFSEEINHLEQQDNPGIDFDYHTPNNRLSEEDIVAMTMLCFGDPEVNGNTYQKASTPEATVASTTGIWINDLGIERHGKSGKMLIPLKASRIDAKDKIEAYDESGNIEILADTIVNGLYANVITMGIPDKVTETYIADSRSLVYINDFIQKPEIKAAVFKMAKERGKLAEIKDAYATVTTAVSLVELTLQKSSCLIEADYATEEEKKKYIHTAEVNDTILKLADHAYNLHNQEKYISIKTEEEKKLDEEFGKKEQEFRKHPGDPEAAKAYGEEAVVYGNDLKYAQQRRPKPGISLFLGTPEGKEVLYKYLDENGIVLGPDSTEKDIDKVYQQLESRHLFPAFPKDINEASVRSYWQDLMLYDPERAVAIADEASDLDIKKTSIDDSDLVVNNVSEMLTAPNWPVGDENNIYHGILYNSDVVKSELDTYKAAHPQATDEDISRTERSLIGREAVIYAQGALYKKANPGASQNEIDGYAHGNPNLISFFSQYDGADMPEMLRQYQSYTLNQNSTLNYERFYENRLKNGVDAFVEKKYDESMNYGKVQHKAFFASKTDSNGLFMDAIFPNHSSARSLLEEWQKDIDSVEIPKTDKIYDGVFEGLIEEIVFGACFKKDRIMKTIERAKSAGSSIPSDADEMTALRTFYFDNLLKNEQRLNTQTFRSIVGEARGEVKGYIDTNNANELYGCLKTTVENCYCQNMSSTGIEEASYFHYCSSMLNKIVDFAETNKVPLDALGLNEKRVSDIRFMKVRDDLSMRRYKLMDKYSAGLVGCNLNQELPDYLNPCKNKEIHDYFVEVSAIRMINKRIGAELGYRGTNLTLSTDFSQLSYYDRELSKTEKLFQQSPNRLLEYYKLLFVQSDEYKEAMQNPEKSVRDIFLDGGAEPKNYNYVEDPVLFERTAAGDVLNSLIDKVHTQREHLKSLPPEQREEGQGVALEALKRIEDKCKHVQHKREGLGNSWSDKNLNIIAKEYIELGKVIEDYNFKTFSMMECVNFSRNIAREGAQLSNQAKAIGELDAQRKYVRELDDGYNDILKSGVTLFEKNYERVSRAFDYSTRDVPMPESVRDLLRDMRNLSHYIRAARNGEGAVDTADLLKEFNNVLDAARNIENDKTLDEDITFVAKGLRQFLESDTKLLDVVDKKITKQDARTKKDKSLDRLIRDARIKTYVAEDGKESDYESRITSQCVKLQELKENLWSWKDRFGGNSKEFDDFYNQFKDLPMRDQSVLIPEKEYIDKLSRVARDYINNKKLVPRTDKGKTRLDIAEQVRDICESIKPMLNHYTMERSMTKHIKIIRDPKEILKSKMQYCVDHIKSNCKSVDNSQVLFLTSELVYLQGLNEKKDSLTDDKLRDLLSFEKISSEVRKLNGVSQAVIDKVTIPGISKEVDSNSFADKMKLRFVKEIADSKKLDVQSAGKYRDKADKADKIIAKENKKKSVNGISL